MCVLYQQIKSCLLFAALSRTSGSRSFCLFSSLTVLSAQGRGLPNSMYSENTVLNWIKRMNNQQFNKSTDCYLSLPQQIWELLVSLGESQITRICGLRVLLKLDVSQLPIQLSPPSWCLLSIPEIKWGREKTVLFSATHHRNPKPRCGPSPSQPTPNFAPQEMPSLCPVSGHLPTPGFEVEVQKCQTTTPRVLLAPGGRTSWFSPTLADSPCIPVCLPSQVRGCQPAHTQRLHPDQKGVRLYIVFRANSPPLTPSPGFSLPKERGQCLTGFPGLLPSLPSSAPSSRKSVLIWQLCQQNFLQ